MNRQVNIKLQSTQTGEFFLSEEELKEQRSLGEPGNRINYDTSLPQPWCDEVANKLGSDYYPAYQFVMLYWGGTTYGRVYPVTEKGVEIFDTLIRRYPEIL